MRIIKFIPIFLIFFMTTALAAEDPDDLYRKGRFSEAEKAYAESDMNHPKDIRYRYNRGCSAYQNSDYQGASAAFSSVLRRSAKNDVRFGAAFNLGNTAFKQGDFQSAANHFKLALKYDPQSEDSRYNLELTLRELEKQKQEKDRKHDESHEGHQGRKEDKKDQSGNDKRSSKDDDSSKGESSKKETGQGEKEKPEQKNDSGSENTQKAERKPPEDLSGELRAQNAMPDEKEKDKTGAEALSLMDKKKAEALLDNMQEDRSRVFRFQVPKEKRRGVLSGKDW